MIIIAATAHLSASAQIGLYIGGGVTPFAGWAIWRTIKECCIGRLREDTTTIREEQSITKNEETKALTYEQIEWMKGRIQLYIRSNRLQKSLDLDRKYSHLHADTEKHIYAIINNEQFQKDSDSYLNAWARLRDRYDLTGYTEWRKQNDHPLLDTALSKDEKWHVDGAAFFVVALYETLCTLPPDFREKECKNRKL